VCATPAVSWPEPCSAENSNRVQETKVPPLPAFAVLEGIGCYWMEVLARDPGQVRHRPTVRITQFGDRTECKALLVKQIRLSGGLYW
jgi:hypothetical protein